MAREQAAQLFIGRLPRACRSRDLEDIFYKYGKMTRCDVKTGIKMSYGFIEYEDKRDAEDAIHNEHGRDMMGSRIVVEWARGPKYDYRKDRERGGQDRDYGKDRDYNNRQDRYDRDYDRRDRGRDDRDYDRREPRDRDRDDGDYDKHDRGAGGDFRRRSRSHSPVERRSHSRSRSRSPNDRRR